MEKQYKIDYQEELQNDLDSKINLWVNGFLKSQIFRNLTEGERKEAKSIIDIFTMYMNEYFGTDPRDWNKGMVTECCLDIMPRKIAEGPVFYKKVGPVLEAFFTFLHKKRYVENGLRLARIVKKIKHEIVNVACDPSNWGMSKSVVMGAKLKGVDTKNKAEMDRYIIDANKYKSPLLKMTRDEDDTEFEQSQMDNSKFNEIMMLLKKTSSSKSVSRFSKILRKIVKIFRWK